MRLYWRLAPFYRLTGMAGIAAPVPSLYAVIRARMALRRLRTACPLMPITAPISSVVYPAAAPRIIAASISSPAAALIASRISPGVLDRPRCRSSHTGIVCLFGRPYVRGVCNVLHAPADTVRIFTGLMPQRVQGGKQQLIAQRARIAALETGLEPYPGVAYQLGRLAAAGGADVRRLERTGGTAGGLEGGEFVRVAQLGPTAARLQNVRQAQNSSGDSCGKFSPRAKKALQACCPRRWSP